jgi:histidinol-phosphate aminotransferase
MGHDVIASQANFVMIDTGRDVQPLIGAMRARGVAVGRLFPALPHHLRVTIGRPDQMERFVAAFRAVTA